MSAAPTYTFEEIMEFILSTDINEFIIVCLLIEDEGELYSFPQLKIITDTIKLRSAALKADFKK